MPRYVRNAVFAALFVALAALSACEIDGSPDEAAAVEPVGTEFTLSMRDMEFVPSRIEVPAGETLTVELVNDGHARHDLLLDPTEGAPGYHAPAVPPGGSATIEIGPFEPGTYEAICTIPGHRQAGMVLEITAR